MIHISEKEAISTGITIEKLLQMHIDKGFTIQHTYTSKDIGKCYVIKPPIITRHKIKNN